MKESANSVEESLKIDAEEYTLSVLEGGVVHVVAKEGPEMTLELARRINGKIREYAESLPAKILYEPPPRHKTSKEAKKYGGSEEAIGVTGRLALIVKSPVAMMAGNGFLFTIKPPYPTRLFTNQESALAWLSGQE